MRHISIIVPVYNEEETIASMVEAIGDVLKDCLYEYSILFVDDGSTDLTLDIIKKLSVKDSFIQYISFSRNFGHQNALKAGLDKANGDCIITMDGDMQHPAHLIPIMLKKYEEGYDVVYTIRKDDKKLPFLKRKTSSLFYSLLNKLSDVKVERGSADFRLLASHVAIALKNLTEYDLFFRGLVKWAGFRQTAIEYCSEHRTKGTTKYTVRKMVRLGLYGILSFSTKPLHFAVYSGFLFSMLSLLYLPYVFYSYYFGYTISGWASVIVTIAFFGGLQLMVLGIIGLYIGRIFMQIKNRPAYLIRETNIL